MDQALLDLTDGTEDFHEIKSVGRHTVRLPYGIAKLDDGSRLRLAFFDLFGAPALGCQANNLLARALAPHLPEGIGLVVIPEGKSVIAGAALADALKVPCVILRKKDRPMRPAVKHVLYRSVTTKEEQKLHLDADVRRCLEAHRSKKALVFDDVVSTGGTVAAVAALLAEYGMDVRFGFIFTEGNEWREHIDPAQVAALGTLPAPVPVTEAA